MLSGVMHGLIPWAVSLSLGPRRRNSMTSRVAELYKNRWLVELFFKWLKQHLKIKKFWGASENSVKIQIHVTIITYCLVAIVHHDMKLPPCTKFSRFWEFLFLC